MIQLLSLFLMVIITFTLYVIYRVTINKRLNNENQTESFPVDVTAMRENELIEFIKDHNHPKNKIKIARDRLMKINSRIIVR